MFTPAVKRAGRELAKQLFGYSFYCLDRAPAGVVGKACRCTYDASRGVADASLQAAEAPAGERSTREPTVRPSGRTELLGLLLPAAGVIVVVVVIIVVVAAFFANDEAMMPPME